MVSEFRLQYYQEKGLGFELYSKRIHLTIRFWKHMLRPKQPTTKLCRIQNDC